MDDEFYDYMNNEESPFKERGIDDDYNGIVSDKSLINTDKKINQFNNNNGDLIRNNLHNYRKKIEYKNSIEEKFDNKYHARKIENREE